MRKKLLAVLLCSIVAATSGMTTAYAENEVTSPVQPEIESRYISLSEVLAGLVIKGDIAHSFGSIQTFAAENTYDLTLYLQRSTDKLHWESIKTWTLTESGDGFHEIYELYSVMSGYYYRTQLDVEVTNGNRVIETETTYSNISKK